MHTITAILLLLAAPPDAPPKPNPLYEAMGAPSHPRVAAQWNRYHDYSDATKLLKELTETFPDRAHLQSLGQSYGKRQMWLLTITNFDQGEASKKPAFWIDGGIHANEIQSVEVVLYTAWYLLEMAPRNAAVQRLLDERTFYLLPMMGPDSRDAHFYQPNTTHSPRSGQRPVDDDRDGLVDEDGPDDLDGDGSITEMRVADPNGRWKPHPDYPHLLVRVKDGEKGQYTRLGTEGYDNDGDGRVNEDGDGYYDPNRDWPWSWQPEAVQRGAIRYPLWVPENRMVADFIAAHPNIAGAQTYHNTAGMILRGPGLKSDSYPAADIRVYDRLGKQGAAMLPGYRYSNVAHDLYEVWGGEFDWLHQMQGIFTFTNELGTPFNYFRQETNSFFGSDETQHRFNKYLLLGEGTVPWKPIDHPQYGKIEVGGMKKNWRRQPPSFLLEEECHRNMAFTLYHADQMPQVKVQSIQVQPLDGGLTQVTAVIENQRLIPTHAASDVKHKITPPDLVTISRAETDKNGAEPNRDSEEDRSDENSDEQSAAPSPAEPNEPNQEDVKQDEPAKADVAEKAPPLKVVLGMYSDDRYFQHPHVQDRQPQQMRLPNIPGEDVVYVRWLVEGSGPYQVTVTSVKGGSDRASSR